MYDNVFLFFVGVFFAIILLYMILSLKNAKDVYKDLVHVKEPKKNRASKSAEKVFISHAVDFEYKNMHAILG